MPASGIRWSSTDQRGIIRSAQPISPMRDFSLASRRRCGSSLWKVFDRWMFPSRSSVMRFSGRGHVLGGEPEVDRVLRHVVERQTGSEPGRARTQDVAVRLAEHLDVTERQLGVRRAPVVVVHAQRLLELGRVRALRDRDHARVDVGHVVAAHDVGRVGEAVRVLVVGGAQEQRRRVGGAAGHHDDVRRCTSARRRRGRRPRG